MGHEDGVRRELKKRRQDRPQLRRPGNSGVGDPGEDRHECRDGHSRIDQAAEFGQDLAGPNFDGADLGDAEIRGTPPGRLEVDDAESYVA